MTSTGWGAIVLLLAQGLAAGACGEKGSATAPTPNPTLDLNVGQITGEVRDTAFRPIAGARVQMLDGPEAGTSTTADAVGEFVLTPSSRAATQFRASKEGFISSTVTLASNNTYRRISFRLDLPAVPVNMAGEFTMTVTADGACRDLPKEARTRTYGATSTAIRLPGHVLDSYFEVGISGQPFLQDFNSFWIGVAGDYVAFLLNGGGQPAVVERLSGTTYVAFGGSASASVETSAPVIATSLDGFIDYCVMKSEADIPIDGFSYVCPPANALVHARCESNNHQLVLQRR